MTMKLAELAVSMQGTLCDPTAQSGTRVTPSHTAKADLALPSPRKR